MIHGVSEGKKTKTYGIILQKMGLFEDIKYSDYLNAIGKYCHKSYSPECTS